MEFTNTFHVPVDIDTTWATLTDLEKVAPCLPGATLEEVDGDIYSGRVKVKVGPVVMTYRGTARLVEADADAKRGRIEASGKESRGAGTASADVVASLVAVDDGTEVTVVTDLNVTGKPAQFGRGVMAEVGTKIIDQFADRLRELVTSDGADASAADDGSAAAPGADGAAPAADAAGGAAPASGGAAPAAGGAAPAGAADAAPSGGEAVATGAAAAAGSTGPRRIEQDPSREDDALDLMDVAGAATLKRLGPLAAAVAAIVAIVWWARGR